MLTIEGEKYSNSYYLGVKIQELAQSNDSKTLKVLFENRKELPLSYYRNCISFGLIESKNTENLHVLIEDLSDLTDFSDNFCGTGIHLFTSLVRFFGKSGDAKALNVIFNLLFNESLEVKLRTEIAYSLEKYIEDKKHLEHIIERLDVLYEGAFIQNTLFDFDPDSIKYLNSYQKLFYKIVEVSKNDKFSEYLKNIILKDLEITREDLVEKPELMNKLNAKLYRKSEAIRILASFGDDEHIDFLNAELDNLLMDPKTQEEERGWREPLSYHVLIFIKSLRWVGNNKTARLLRYLVGMCANQLYVDNYTPKIKMNVPHFSFYDKDQDWEECFYHAVDGLVFLDTEMAIDELLDIYGEELSKLVLFNYSDLLNPASRSKEYFALKFISENLSELDNKRVSSGLLDIILKDIESNITECKDDYTELVYIMWDKVLQKDASFHNIEYSIHLLEEIGGDKALKILEEKLLKQLYKSDKESIDYQIYLFFLSYTPGSKETISLMESLLKDEKEYLRDYAKLSLSKFHSRKNLKKERVI